MERHCHIHGDVKAVAIGDNNTVNNIDRFRLDKHQVKAKQRRGKPHKRGNRRKRTFPDIKRGCKIKDPRINQGSVDQAQDVPQICNEDSAVAHTDCIVGPYIKGTWLDNLKNKNDSLAIQAENEISFDVSPKDNPDKNPDIIKPDLCRDICQMGLYADLEFQKYNSIGDNRRLADVHDVEADDDENVYSFNNIHKPLTSDMKSHQRNLFDSCNNNNKKSYLGSSKLHNNGDGHSKMSVSDIPEVEHCHACRSCMFLDKVAEKLGEKKLLFADIQQEDSNQDESRNNA